MLIAYLLQYNRYLNLVGIAVIFIIAYCLSTNRKKINYSLIISAFGLQCVAALFALRFEFGKQSIAALAAAVVSMYRFADAGSSFVFGNLVNADSPMGFIFAFKVLPVTIFFSAFVALMFHFNILQHVVAAVSYVLRPLLAISGAESLCAIANSFLGQTEAPLLVRNYLKNMTKSEFFLVMVSGMSTISAAILVVYAAMGVPAEHMLASSIMSIFGAMVLAKIIIPETDTPETHSKATVTFEQTSTNMFDAIATGTSDGLMLALAIAAMLISFVALLAFGNGILAFLSAYVNSIVPTHLSFAPLTIDKIMGYLFMPFAYLLGFTGNEAFQAGQLIGIKVAVNELIAYSELVTMNLSPRTVAIITYALCGFSNFSCIGIQIGGIGALAPNKRAWLTSLGVYAVAAAALSNLLSAMIVALLI